MKRTSVTRRVLCVLLLAALNQVRTARAATTTEPARTSACGMVRAYDSGFELRLLAGGVEDFFDLAPGDLDGEELLWVGSNVCLDLVVDDEGAVVSGAVAPQAGEWDHSAFFRSCSPVTQFTSPTETSAGSLTMTYDDAAETPHLAPIRAGTRICLEQQALLSSGEEVCVHALEATYGLQNPFSAFQRDTASTCDADTPSEAPPPGSAPADVEGGCHAAGSPHSSLALVVLSVALWLARRRAQRPRPARG